MLLNPLDAVVAAPRSHIVLHEDDRVRVLRVVIHPGDREPEHVHEWPSTFIPIRPARIRYYGPGGVALFETKGDTLPNVPQEMEPEGLHAVENIDRVVYEAIRIEYKPR